VEALERVRFIVGQLRQGMAIEAIGPSTATHAPARGVEGGEEPCAAMAAAVSAGARAR